jgi:hypothetical protein
MYIDKRSLLEGNPGEYLKLAWAINPTKTKKLIALQVPNIEVSQANISQIANVDYFNFRQFLRQFQTSTDELLTAYAKGRVKAI